MYRGLLRLVKRLGSFVHLFRKRSVEQPADASLSNSPSNHSMNETDNIYTVSWDNIYTVSWSGADEQSYLRRRQESVESLVSYKPSYTGVGARSNIRVSTVGARRVSHVGARRNVNVAMLTKTKRKTSSPLSGLSKSVLGLTQELLSAALYGSANYRNVQKYSMQLYKSARKAIGSFFNRLSATRSVVSDLSDNRSADGRSRNVFSRILGNLGSLVGFGTTRGAGRGRLPGGNGIGIVGRLLGGFGGILDSDTAGRSKGLRPRRHDIRRRSQMSHMIDSKVMRMSVSKVVAKSFSKKDMVRIAYGLSKLGRVRSTAASSLVSSINDIASMLTGAMFGRMSSPKSVSQVSRNLFGSISSIRRAKSVTSAMSKFLSGKRVSPSERKLITATLKSFGVRSASRKVSKAEKSVRLFGVGDKVKVEDIVGRTPKKGEGVTKRSNVQMRRDERGTRGADGRGETLPGAAIRDSGVPHYDIRGVEDPGLFRYGDIAAPLLAEHYGTVRPTIFETLSGREGIQSDIGVYKPATEVPSMSSIAYNRVSGEFSTDVPGYSSVGSVGSLARQSYNNLGAPVGYDPLRGVDYSGGGLASKPTRGELFISSKMYR